MSGAASASNAATDQHGRPLCCASAAAAGTGVPNVGSMHPTLSAHRHPECEALIDKLNACHRERTIAKFFGQCNDIKTELDHCFDREVRSRVLWRVAWRGLAHPRAARRGAGGGRSWPS